MKNLQNIVTSYLGRETDYALQIVGKWGSGKTHYYKNFLENVISKTKTYEDQDKTYKAIYISLFGLKSVEDIATKIVIEFFQSKAFQSYNKRSWFRKRIRITVSVLKITLRGFLNYKKLGSINEHLADIKDIGKEALDTKELLICLDDLERRDSSFKINDVIGYINSLVDEKTKVIIIANEDSLLKDPSYKEVKEKIIGITLEYSPDSQTIIKQIIETKFQSFKIFKEFLLNRTEAIEKYSKSLDNNFRHLIYGLDSLHTIYSIIKNEILDKENFLKDQVVQQLDNIATLTLVLAAEYKASNINFSNIEDYKDDSKILLHLIKKSEDSTNIPLYNLLNRYNLDVNNYYMYESIYYYITGYDEFDISKFISEFRNKFKIQDDAILPQYKILDSLSYHNVYDLSNEEYKQLTEQMLEYAKAGLYQDVDYLTVMHYAERFRNILNLNILEVRQEIASGLNVSINKIKSVEEFAIRHSGFRINGSMTELKENVEHIYEYGLTQFETLEKKLEIIETGTLTKYLTNNFEDLRNKYENDSRFRYKFNNASILDHINPVDLVNTIANYNNKDIRYLRLLFSERYNNNRKLIDEDKPKIIAILPFLDEKVSKLKESSSINIKAYLLSELNDYLKEQFEVQ